ncbi:MAG: hypothetical protein U0869_18950 [Chloroflexota bacterium]
MQVRSTSSLSRAARRLLPITAAAALAVAALPGAASATSYGTNLVKNGSFENGLASWETFVSPTTRTYKPATGGFPSPSQGSNIGGGSRFAYLGPNEVLGCGDLSQAIKLTGLNSAIDSGHVKVRFKGYAATQGGASFNAHIDLYFRTADNHNVPNGSNGITRKVSQTNQQYRSISVTKTLPKGTRLLRVHLWADGDDPSSSGDCPGFYDKLSVTLIRS